MRFEGKFEKGKRAVKRGDGTVVYVDGSTYEGGFRSGRCNGFGTHRDGRTGATYVGKWVGGKRNGNGTETSASGARWTGTWEDGKRHGNGTEVGADGVTRRGRWERGEVKEWLAEGEEKKE